MAMTPEEYAEALAALDREHAEGTVSDPLWEVRRTQLLARAATVRTWPVSFLIFSAVILCLLLFVAAFYLLARSL